MNQEHLDRLDYAEARAQMSEPDGRDGELLLHKCCADLGVNLTVALQVIAWAEENIAAPRGTGIRARDQGHAVLMASIIKILEYVYRHPALTHIYAVIYAFGEKSPLLDDVIGHLCPKEFAHKIRVEREAVNKAVLAVQAEFRLPPRRGQRGAGARKNMSRARLKQLTRA